VINMVKFGRHLQFYLECDELKSGTSKKPYIVPYKDIRGAIGESQEEFQHFWLESLKAASDDYTQRVRSLWQQIFTDLFRLSGQDENVLRGLPHEDAVQLYLSTMSEKRSRDLLTTIKRLHSNATMNAEALRKLVKKYDKHATARGDDILTISLLPELYSAPLMNAAAIERYIEILRDKLVDSEEEEEESLDEYMTSIKEKTQLTSSAKDALDVQRRASEMFWLHDLIQNKIPQSDIPMLVAHRGEKSCHFGVWYEDPLVVSQSPTCHNLLIQFTQDSIVSGTILGSALLRILFPVTSRLGLLVYTSVSVMSP
jgi:SPX domain protein involved in polyphosphate accumulation